MLCLLLGMPHSGTSCMAALLVRAGFGTGTIGRTFIGQDPRVAKHGYYENQRAAEMMKMILRDAGGNYRTRVPAKSSVEEMLHNRREMIGTFAKDYDGKLLKCPEATLAMPKIARMLRATHIIYMLRNVSAVERSTNRINGAGESEGVAKAWPAYYNKYGHSELPELIVDFDEFPLHGFNEYVKALRFLGCDISKEAAHKIFRDTYDPGFTQCVPGDTMTKDIGELERYLKAISKGQRDRYDDT